MARWQDALPMTDQQAKEGTPQAPSQPNKPPPKAPSGLASIPEDESVGTPTPDQIAAQRRQLAADLWERGLPQAMAPSIPEAVPYVAEPAIDEALAIAQAYGLDPQENRKELQALLKYRELTGVSPVPQTSSVQAVEDLLRYAESKKPAEIPTGLYESRFDPARSTGGAIPLVERPIYLKTEKVSDPREWPAKAEQAQAVRDKQARLQEIQEQIKTLQSEYDNLLQQ